MRVLLVEVGHGGYEPAVVHLAEIVFRCVRVYVGSQLEGCLHKVVFMVGIVEPVFAGHVLYPYVLYAAVVENHIHYDFNAACMRLFDESLIFFVGAEAGVYLVVIGGGIAVVRTAGHVVFQYRSKPQGGHAQIGKIVEVLFDTREVAAMTGIRVVAVYLVLCHACYLVVVGITVGKTVGHQQVERVGRVETFVLAALFGTCL